MFHHDNRDYTEAASAAAKQGRIKMEELIHRGRTGTEAVVATIQNASITDKVVPAPRLRLHHDPDENGPFKLAVVDPVANGYGYTSGDEAVLHPHAYGQLLQDLGLPKRYADGLMYDEAKGSEWGRKLVAHSANEILSHRTKQRNLLRIDNNGGNRIKGFLSDKFRRLDSRPLCDAFLGACTEFGLMPYEGVASETKCRVRAVLPRVFEPIPNEVMVFGLEFGNSDYGDGGVVVNLWCMRVWCTNLAVVTQGLRQVHLGRALPDDIALSQRTYELDAKTVASAVKDITGELIGPNRVHATLAGIASAGDETVKSRGGMEALLKGLSKEESRQVSDLFNGGDVVNMPPAPTVYRLSNAVSFFAQRPGLTADRRLELQSHAGKMLSIKGVVAEEV